MRVEGERRGRGEGKRDGDSEGDNDGDGERGRVPLAAKKRKYFLKNRICGRASEEIRTKSLIPRYCADDDAVLVDEGDVLLAIHGKLYGGTDGAGLRGVGFEASRWLE